MKPVQELIQTLSNIEQLLELQGLDALKNDIPIIKDYIKKIDNWRSNPDCTDIVMIFTEEQFFKIKTEVERVKKL